MATSYDTLFELLAQKKRSNQKSSLRLLTMFTMNNLTQAFVNS